MTETPYKTYKNMIVWSKSIELVKMIYKTTRNYPASEQFSLVNQIRRAVVSIPSNIAEGYGRRSHKEYLNFIP
jgi:four helix bundle protein